MKHGKAIILVLLLLTACDSAVTSNQYETAKTYCASHSGVHSIKRTGADVDKQVTVTCNDDVQMEFSTKQDETP